jgi:magnesium and cobalt transporter
MTDDSSTSSTQLGKSGWWARLFPGRDDFNSREGLVAILDEYRERGLLAADEYAMLTGVLQVSETQVREIMVPRSHMVVLQLGDPPDKLLGTIIESGHSRFPVIGEDRDQIIGILLAKDLLKHFSQDANALEIEKILRPAAFIPESKRLNTLLTEFRQSHNHMAIVVDEYGGVSGLATIEDVLEEIVGEIDDEHDPEEAAQIQDSGEGRFLVAALARIEEFNDFFGSSLSDEEYETVGGLIMHELGRLPRRGESLDFGGFRFKVLRADRRRIHAVEVMPAPLAQPE